MLRLRMEKRRGKPVTIVAVEGLSDADIKALGKELKNLCATGGATKNGEIELQGEHRDRVREFLVSKSYDVRG